MEGQKPLTPRISAEELFKLAFHCNGHESLTWKCSIQSLHVTYSLAVFLCSGIYLKTFTKTLLFIWLQTNVVQDFMSFRVHTVKTGRKSDFSSTSGRCCFVTDTFTSSPSFIKSLDLLWICRDKSGVLLFGFDSVSFALLFCVEHQTCLVQQWDCLEIEILCPRKQLLNTAYMCSVQIFIAKYLKTWWTLYLSMIFAFPRFAVSKLVCFL